MSATAVAGLAATLACATAVAARAAAAATRRGAVRRRLAGPGGPVPRAGALTRPPGWLARWLDRAGVDAAPEPVWRNWMSGVAVTTAVVLLAAGPLPAVLAGAGAAVAPAALLWARRGHGDARVERDLPVALEATARSLRSGASLAQAVAEAARAVPGPLGRELDEVTRQVGHGAALVDALDALAARRDRPGVRLAVAALCLGADTGGARARAVDGVAATMRDRLAVAGEVRALSSQARISALVIGVAPLAFGAFAVTTDPRTGAFLFHTPAGLAMLAAGIGLDGLGWMWMRRLTRVAA